MAYDESLRQVVAQSRVRDPRCARGRAQEGRSAQGAPPSAVLEALTRLAAPLGGSVKVGRARAPALRPGIGGSSSGRTSDSDSENLGSNPSPPANLQLFPDARGEVRSGSARFRRQRLEPPTPRSGPLLQHLHAARAADQQHVGRPVREDADRHDARDLVEARLQLERIRDLQIVHVEDVIAVVGDEVLRARSVGRRPSPFAARRRTAPSE